MRRRSRGFTLVELLVVIALVAMGAAIAASSMRSTRGDKAASFSRALIAHVNMVRHTAITQQQPARLVGQASANGVTYQLVSQIWNPATSAFQDLGATITAPMDVLLCTPDNSPVMSTATPSCPLSTSFGICFLPSGASYLQTTTTCPTIAAPAGATLYVATVTKDKKYKVPLFGLTGMAKLMDTW